jgi:hypothetical protein
LHRTEYFVVAIQRHDDHVVVVVDVVVNVFIIEKLFFSQVGDFTYFIIN